MAGCRELAKADFAFACVLIEVGSASVRLAFSKPSAIDASLASKLSQICGTNAPPLRLFAL
jgi:hypothetical protein